MEKAVSAAQANRTFSELLRGVRKGHSYLVTSHGRPVARLVPVDGGRTVASGALPALLRRMRSEPVIEIGRWRREELYEDEK